LKRPAFLLAFPSAANDHRCRRLDPAWLGHTEDPPMKTHLLACAVLLAVALPALADEDKAGPNDNHPPKGFTALFNGKDLTNWQGAIDFGKRSKMSADERTAAHKTTDAKVLPHWHVEDGILFNDGGGGNLGSAQDFGNFELYVDWKIEPRGDSGIYLRGQPQVQIWDSDHLDPKQYVLEYKKGSGALWNNRAKKDKVPLKHADKEPGQWNTFYIVMKDGKVTVKLNGELVVDNTALDNYFEKDKPLPAKGPIELQQHYRADGKPGKLWFKNIYIKELAD
jgi:hypothetical protein